MNQIDAQFECKIHNLFVNAIILHSSFSNRILSNTECYPWHCKLFQNRYTYVNWVIPLFLAIRIARVAAWSSVAVLDGGPFTGYTYITSRNEIKSHKKFKTTEVWRNQIMKANILLLSIWTPVDANTGLCDVFLPVANAISVHIHIYRNIAHFCTIFTWFFLTRKTSFKPF